MSPSFSLEHLPQFKRFKTITPIVEGWSHDQKFDVTDDQNQRFLLRISDLSLASYRLQQFQQLKSLNALNLNIPKAIDAGVTSSYVYVLLSYVQGSPLIECIQTFSDEKQYFLGIQAGQILKQIHHTQTPPPSSWRQAYQEKIAKRIERFERPDILLPKKERVTKYLKNQLPSLGEPKWTLTHGDYHIGNMLIHEETLGIIDFDRMQMMDSIDEFKPFCWNARISPFFQTGLVEGYFDFSIPEDFFFTLSIYAAEFLTSHYPWALSFGQEETRIAQDVYHEVMGYYQNFTQTVPTWFIRPLSLNPIILSDYQTSWSSEFERIKTVLETHLNDQIITIEHIGSTAVKGLIAKPILDIDLIIHDDVLLETVIHRLHEIGYEYEGNKGISGREAFRRKDPTVPWTQPDETYMAHHLYVMRKDAIELHKHLALREALRADKDLVKAYGELKRKLASIYRFERNQYTEGKTEFIQSILKKS